MTKFVPIYDLSKLPEDERNAYYLRACEHFKIPADLNLLELLWLDDGYSQRKLVLYAKKGATDILRGNLGISVDEMTKEVANDVVTFTAKGHDATGRTDIATGAAVIKNLSGQKLEFAYMTAQTRATRRLTLQFAGGGLLDESEVLHGAVSNATSSVVAQMATQAPVPAPNMQPGKDITEEEGRVVPELVRLFVEPKKHRPIRLGGIYDGVISPDLPTTEVPESPSADIPESQRPVTYATGNIVEDIGKSFTFEVGPSIPKEITDAADALARDMIKADKAAVDRAVEQAANDLGYHKPPSAEQAVELRMKLYHYINVLTEAGMVPSENVGGGYRKLEAFILKNNPGVDSLKDFSLRRWNAMFDKLDNMLQEKGPKGLVQYIDSVVEAK